GASGRAANKQSELATSEAARQAQSTPPLLKAVYVDGKILDRSTRPATIFSFAAAERAGHDLVGMGENAIITKVIRARRSDFALGWMAVLAIPALLIAPAIWNGYPLLQYDTGGYLARWYEGYLVPSRSTVFGLYLHFGQGSYFWLNLGIQALATLWILQLTLRVFSMRTPFYP